MQLVLRMSFSTLSDLCYRVFVCSPFISQNGCVVCMETELQLVQLGEANATNRSFTLLGFSCKQLQIKQHGTLRVDSMVV
jgi:hypothetical protein